MVVATVWEVSDVHQDFSPQDPICITTCTMEIVAMETTSLENKAEHQILLVNSQVSQSSISAWCVCVRVRVRVRVITCVYCTNDVVPCAEKPVSLDTFLKRLPANVLKNGRIINVRSDIEKQMNVRARAMQKA